jgi:hypothetical protein
MGAVLRGLAAAGCVALAALPACSGVESDGAPRGGERGADEAGAAAAHGGFLDALRAADAGRASAFLDGSPELTLFPVQGDVRLDGPAEAGRGLEAMFRAIGPAEWTTVHEARVVRGGAAWFTYQFAVEAEGRPEPLLGRGSEVWVHRPDGWKLAHGHWSSQP